MHRSTTLRVSARRKPQVVDSAVSFSSQVQDIRLQLGDQLKCLDLKLESQTGIVLELQDFFRKKAEVELEYSKNLEKLTKQFMFRHKSEKQKRESWSTLSTFSCWQYLMNITKKESRDHAALAELYGNLMVQRFADIADDLKRLFLRGRDIGGVCHEEISKLLNELQTAMKQYHVYHSESKQTEFKVKHIEDQRNKVEQQALRAAKKFKVLEQQADKEQLIYQENKLKTLNARNDYLLSIEAANASIKKYFVDDLPMIIDATNFGHVNSVQRAMLSYVSAIENLRTSHQVASDSMNKCVQEVDVDKRSFIEANGLVFGLPKRFEYQPHKGDEVCQVSAQKLVQDDILQRYQQLNNRVESLRVENEEMWKSLEEADKNLVSMINLKDYDVTELFQSEALQLKSPVQPMDARKKRQEIENYYFQKLSSMLQSNNLLARLQARHMLLKKALGDDSALVRSSGTVSRGSGGSGGTMTRPPSLPPKPVRARIIGKTPVLGQPKVFGCNLEEYIEATGEEIPLVVRSCIRAINLFGMHHEGIFRVSGLQMEINEIKANFDKGLDPLANLSDSNSVNSIAGALKSFFRELKESLLPMHLFDALVEASRLNSNQEIIGRINKIVQSLPRSRVVVARYLFAFLNHLSEYSDENLMYPYNLSVCFGPTLMPTPPEKDQVAYQTNVNDVVKVIIIHQDKIFPADGGPIYEKILTDTGTRDEGDGSDYDHSDEEETADIIEAVAVYDFDGRSARELSFKKGDVLVLFSQQSPDWWDGACKGKEGLIPDKYITLKRNDDSSNVMNSSVAAADTKPAGVTEASQSERSLDLSSSIASLSRPVDLQPSLSSSVKDTLLPDRLLAHGPPSPLSEAVTFRLNEAATEPNSDGDYLDQRLSTELDSVMAEVLSDLHSLVNSHKVESAATTHTQPDLVMDLPVAVGSEDVDRGTLLQDRKATSDVSVTSDSPLKPSGKSSSLPRSLLTAGSLGNKSGTSLSTAGALPSPPPYMTDEPGRQLVSFKRGGSAGSGEQVAAVTARVATQVAPDVSSAMTKDAPYNKSSSDMGTFFRGGSKAVPPQVATSGTTFEERRLQQSDAAAMAVNASVKAPVTTLPPPALAEPVGLAADICGARKMPPPIPVKAKPSATSVATALKQQQLSSAKKSDGSTQL